MKYFLLFLIYYLVLLANVRTQNEIPASENSDYSEEDYYSGYAIKEIGVYPFNTFEEEEEEEDYPLYSAEPEKSYSLEQEKSYSLEQEKSYSHEQERSYSLEQEKPYSLEDERSYSLEQEKSYSLEQEEDYLENSTEEDYSHERENAVEDAQKLGKRIVGGDMVDIRLLPYQISLRKSGSHICGGSIISNYHILTAAHCFIGDSDYGIKAGSTYVSRGGVDVPVCEIYPHSHYNSETMVNDIAIMKLCHPLKFTKSVAPVRLPNASYQLLTDSYATVSGWGHVRENGGMASQSLRKVDVPIISIYKCQTLYSDAKINNNHVCAGFVGVGKKDACQGDSGGPLVQKGVQIGIVSWGYGCARPWSPGVYTSVEKYLNWISDVTKL